LTRAPKLAILMRLAMRVVVDPETIVPKAITAVKAVDFSYARDLGCTIRQVARAQQVKGRRGATVGPMLVDLRSADGVVAGTENMVILTGHYGATWFSRATARAGIRRRLRW